jgi:hypothetical protein
MLVFAAAKKANGMSVTGTIGRPYSGSPMSKPS